ncbi:MAG TPA: hypothetical protein VIC59_03730 [Gemmatimonadota bacterium]|jgi:hypothetical protein
MPPSRVSCLPLLAAILLLPARTHAQSSPTREVSGSLVSVSVEVDGAPVPLFRAPDGSERWYLEAREGSAYAVTVANRTDERLGVVIAVDGLNVISGERQRWPSWWGRSDPGRMYVLQPWGAATVQGWRTSLDEVRRFTFVDEEISYAARSGKTTSKMGWIEVAVFRERERSGLLGLSRDKRVSPAEESGGRDEADFSGQASSGAPEPATQAAPEGASGPARSNEDDAQARKAPSGEVGSRARSYPGTGWGTETNDRAVLVEFEPERRPAQRITVRYEYAPTLVTLGVLPRPRHATDRLAERERGELGKRGFAPSPLW